MAVSSITCLLQQTILTFHLPNFMPIGANQGVIVDKKVGLF